MATAALPLFHLYGDPPDDQAFDFIQKTAMRDRRKMRDVAQDVIDGTLRPPDVVG